MWYKKYGWRANPFLAKPSPLLVGLENERRSLKEFVASENVCLLFGPIGSGKTSLLLWLKNELKKTHTSIYLNSTKINHTDDLIAALRKQRTLLDKLFFRPYPKNTVLALDDVQALPVQTAEFIKVLWDEGNIRSIILASTNKNLSNFTDSFKHRVGERIVELTKLTKSEAIDLVKLRAGQNNPFDGDALEKLTELVGYSPRKILEFCEKICKCYAEKGAKIINRADIEELVGPAYPTPTKLVPKKLEVAEKQKLVSPPTKLTKLPEHAPKKLSPLQKTLIQLLEREGKTMAELSEITGSSVGTIGKQLSVLQAPQKDALPKPPFVNQEKEIPKKKRERKGLIADRIKEFFRTNEQKWYEIAQIAKALGMSPYSSSLHMNLKKLVREGILIQKKKKNKIYFMRK